MAEKLRVAFLDRTEQGTLEFKSAVSPSGQAPVDRPPPLAPKALQSLEGHQPYGLNNATRDRGINIKHSLKTGHLWAVRASSISPHRNVITISELR